MKLAKHEFVFLVVLGVGVAASSQVRADCSSGQCIPGGGKARTDCYGTFFADGLLLNFPFPNPATGKARRKRELRCFDGDAGCDRDGEVNGVCRFNVGFCLFDDTDVATCTPSEVVAAEVTLRGGTDGGALADSIAALLPAGAHVCTGATALDVPLRVSTRGHLLGQKTRVVVTYTGADGKKDRDRIQLRCLPRLWPSHSYNNFNHRASPQETQINPSNVDTLELKWQFDTPGGVTSTPTVSSKFVYVSSWDGRVYALRKKTGKVRWSFDTGTDPHPSGGIPGVQSSVTVSPDGRVLFGDSIGRVYCVDGRNGNLLWQADVAGADGASAHVWSPPTIANNRVFVGRSSHLDQPCVQGHLYAFDLDTGAELWRVPTVPPFVCADDTAIECGGVGMDPVCPGSQQCVAGLGGAVTGNVATDVTGETVYMGTVGCFTFPSIGFSDSLFSIDAADGSINWVHRSTPIEQLAGGPPYRDYGFLNAPLFIDDGVTRAVVGVSKDGSIHARDPDTGAEVWTTIAGDPMGGFGGFGLFNGPAAFADGLIYTSLYEFFDGSPAAIDHVLAWHASTGANAWTPDVDLNPNWAATAVANGVLYLGAGALGGPAEFYAYDAATGVRLAAFPLPTQTTSGPSIVDGVVYIGFEIFGSAGGVAAFGLP